MKIPFFCTRQEGNYVEQGINYTNRISWRGIILRIGPLYLYFRAEKTKKWKWKFKFDARWFRLPGIDGLIFDYSTNSICIGKIKVSVEALYDLATTDRICHVRVVENDGYSNIEVITLSI